MSFVAYKIIVIRGFFYSGALLTIIYLHKCNLPFETKCFLQSRQVHLMYTVHGACVNVHVFKNTHTAAPMYTCIYGV